MNKKVKIYELGLIPIIVRTKEDCERAGILIERMAMEAIKNNLFYYESCSDNHNVQ